MTYKSKLSIILKMEEEKQKKMQEELRILQHLKQQILQELAQEEANTHLFLEELKKGGTVSSSFFSGSNDHAYRLKKEKELHDIGQLLLLKNKEYHTIKKKIEHIQTLDKEREKEFYKEIEKKEAREIEELKTMMKHLEKGGE